MKSNNHCPKNYSITGDWYPGDLEYVDVDNPVDYLPEFAHGRISVDNANQANTVVDKIIHYENNSLPGNFYDKASVIAYFEDGNKVHTCMIPLPGVL